MELLERAEAFAAKPVANVRGCGHHEDGDLDEDFAAIGVVRVAIDEVGVRQQAVKQQQHGSRINQIVQAAPQAAGHAVAQHGRADHHKEQVEGDGSQHVDGGLQGRVDGHQKVEEAEVRAGGQQQDGRVQKQRDQRQIGGPAMEREVVPMAVGPVPHGTVAHGDEHAQQQVDGNEPDGGQADVSAEIENGDSEG
ncbi:Sodium/potassium/calcium exchanger 1, putative [Acidobacterium capsulatum ATCC 51196]|uniref:Sodium/potassium/calcium exchanger 1, putative n=1 Tax=Acidobacterium capsulatum (strain ATCC 51196 / DSM 11244 / BCRC 80197 / JCM 7670 / NBRC 15755 / NCIMB 13165 / 161) TaxID=240015 RepID=C1F3Q5_ACIC5|nr:Sodium/potassium/calcium exchanger 1, putative [Acidobacterium capsulatum ATCC 51196]